MCNTNFDLLQKYFIRPFPTPSLLPRRRPPIVCFWSIYYTVTVIGVYPPRNRNSTIFTSLKHRDWFQCYSTPSESGLCGYRICIRGRCVLMHSGRLNTFIYNAYRKFVLWLVISGVVFEHMAYTIVFLYISIERARHVYTAPHLDQRFPLATDAGRESKPRLILLELQGIPTIAESAPRHIIGGFPITDLHMRTSLFDFTLLFFFFWINKYGSEL